MPAKIRIRLHGAPPIEIDNVETILIEDPDGDGFEIRPQVIAGGIYITSAGIGRIVIHPTASNGCVIKEA